MNNRDYKVNKTEKYADTEIDTETTEKKKKVSFEDIAVVVLLSIIGTGIFLLFTNYGFFLVYFTWCCIIFGVLWFIVSIFDLKK